MLTDLALYRVSSGAPQKNAAEDAKQEATRHEVYGENQGRRKEIHRAVRKKCIT